MKTFLFFALLLLAPQIRAENAPAPVEPATLIVWNREIAVFRANIGNLTPAQRRDNTLNRMSALSDELLWSPVRAEKSRFGSVEGTAFMLGDQLLFVLIPEDMDSAAGESLSDVSSEVVKRLEELRIAKQNQRSLPVILKGIGIILAATLGFVLLVRILRWLGQRLRRFVIRRTAQFKKLKVRDFDLRPVMLQVFRRVLVMIGWLVAFTGAYLWISTILKQFPYTAPWGRMLGMQIRELIQNLLQGILSALPGLAVVLVIFAITRWSARLADHLFRQFEHAEDDSSWLAHDTARATRRIAVVLIWIFGITIAYPYIPGSESPAFKGISVFVGLMVSLGSTGLVNQVMSGFVVLYSGAVRTGEYARVGDTEGTITEIGMLSTKVLTPRREYVTVPNAVLISKETLNYSRMAENDQRTELSTSVTIGYDAPWRQVHAMLLLAAERTPGIRREPASRVLQTELSDFFVNYELRFVPAEVSRRGAILSDLHQNIQDVFNEYGVQIMSPNFEAQPEQVVLSPKDKWYAAPASPPKAARDSQSDS